MKARQGGGDDIQVKIYVLSVLCAATPLPELQGALPPLAFCLPVVSNAFEALFIFTIKQYLLSEAAKILEQSHESEFNQAYKNYNNQINSVRTERTIG